MSVEKKVTVIGAGPMGLAIANAFLKNEYETTVWNRTSEKLRVMESGAAKIAPSLIEAVSNSPIIIICVLNYEVVDDLFQSFGNELSGKVVVNLTNGTPEQVNKSVRLFTSKGAGYIDGGIMAIPPTIGTAHSFILFSGNTNAFNEHKDTLNILGQAQFVGEDYGLASLYDLSLLTAMYGMIGGYFQAVSLVATGNISAADFTPIVTSWLQAMLGALPHLSQQIDARDYELGGVLSSVDTNVVGIANIIKATKHQNVASDFMLPWEFLLNELVKKGNGKKDLSAVVELIKE